jgi:hypothetical protein
VRFCRHSYLALSLLRLIRLFVLDEPGGEQGASQNFQHFGAQTLNQLEAVAFEAATKGFVQALGSRPLMTLASRAQAHAGDCHAPSSSRPKSAQKLGKRHLSARSNIRGILRTTSARSPTAIGQCHRWGGEWTLTPRFPVPCQDKIKDGLPSKTTAHGNYELPAAAVCTLSRRGSMCSPRYSTQARLMHG